MKGVQERGEMVGVIGDADMTGRGRTGDIAGSADPDHANVREFGSRREGNEPVREEAGVDEHDRLAASLIAVLDFRIADSKALHDFVPHSGSDPVRARCRLHAVSGPQGPQHERESGLDRRWRQFLSHHRVEW